MTTELSIEDRRSKVAEILSIKGFTALTDLVRLLGVSDSTVRRDLEILEEQGILKRTHGGAVYVKESHAHSLAFADREMTSATEKQSIAKVVAELIPAGQTLILDGGTTCFQVARAIQGRRLSVITNSVPIASLLSTDLATEVTLVGGYVYPRTGVALGATATSQLDSLHAAQLVLSCEGVTDEGVFNANQIMVEVEQRMMQSADEVILAVDSRKLNRRAVVRVCGLDELNVIVTDDRADAESRQWLSRLKAKIIYAPV
jgi:DeoR/GlpR family transcriptional regulator of sugar metabolism